MQALVKRDVTQAGVSLEEVPVPSPGPGQLRVAVAATGICGTDLHIMDDEYAVSMPVVMGHEVTGVVDELGAGVASSWVGRRVAVETYFSTCEACFYCREGQRNLCAGRQSIGTHVNGGFAEYVVVPAVNAHEVHQSVSRFAGGLYEPLSCVSHALCDPSVASPGDQAVVFGPGAMGLLAAQVLAAQGANVTVVGLASDRARLVVAEDLGLRTVEEPASPELSSTFDVVVDCSGSASGVAAGLRTARRGGRYVQIGLCGKVVPLDLDSICLHELVVSSGFASTPRSWRRAERLVGSGLVRLEPLVSGVVGLSQWDEAVARARAADGVKFMLAPAL
jgi:L-iditol 2-dehydrogenase